MASATHEELVGELPKLEKLSNAARLKHARKRRSKQLKCWKDWLRQERATNGSMLRRRNEPQLQFEDRALLTDLVNRNDIIGGKHGRRCEIAKGTSWPGLRDEGQARAGNYVCTCMKG